MEPVRRSSRVLGPRFLLFFGGLVGAAAAGVRAAGSEEGPTLLAPGFVLAAGLLLFVPPRRVLSVVRPSLAALLVAAVLVLAFHALEFQLVLLLLAACPLLLFLVLASEGAPRAAGLVLGLALCAFGLSLAELLLARRDGGTPAVYTHLSDGDIHDYRGRFDRLVPGGRMRHRAVRPDGSFVYDALYRVDQDRSRRVPGAPAAGDARPWFFFGGSYCFGVGNDDGKTIQSYLQAGHPEARLRNFAVWGFGTAEVQLYLSSLVPRTPDLSLCVYLMIEDHVRRAACIAPLTATWGGRKPRMVVEDGALRYVGRARDTLGILGRLDVGLLRRSHLYRRIPRATSGFEGAGEDLAFHLIRAMEAECDRLADCPFLVVLLPTPRSHVAAQGEAVVDGLYSPEDLAPDRDPIAGLLERLGEAGVAVCDLRERFARLAAENGDTADDWFFVETHGRAAYNRLMAEWIDGCVRAVR